MRLALDWKSVTPAWINAALGPMKISCHLREGSTGSPIDMRQSQMNGSNCSRVPECSALTGLCRSRFCQLWVVSLAGGGLAGTGWPWAVFQGGDRTLVPRCCWCWWMLVCIRQLPWGSSRRQLELALSMHCSHRGCPTCCVGQQAASLGHRGHSSVGLIS